MTVEAMIHHLAPEGQQDTPDAPVDYQLTLSGWLALHPQYRRLFEKMTG